MDMKMALVAICGLAVCSIAQVSADENPDSYSKGFKDGWKEGYEQARKELGSLQGPSAPVVESKPMPFPITISFARYGDSSRDCDATSYVARRANGRMSVSVDVTNGMCGDPSPGQRKSLDVTYICGNRSKTASAYEHRAVYLDCSY
jgi:hypothetical protein